jgi:hypothetical protein
MLSYTQLVDEYKSFTNDKTTENATFGAGQVNSSIKARLGEDDWIFLEKVATADTVASQQSYQLPADFAQMRTVTVAQGSTIWPVAEAPSRQFWDTLNTITFTSDIAQYYYILGNTIKLYPTPSSNGNDITYNYKKRVPQLSAADYETGTVAIDNAGTTVTGSGTTFTAAMVGRSIMTTDGYWYEISGYTSATVLTIITPYLGSTITGATYTIGQLSPLPDAYEELPVYDAVSDYFARQGGFEKEKVFRERADELAKKMKAEQGAKSTSPRIRSGSGDTINPNLYGRL